MIETLTASGFGPIAGYIAVGRASPRYINIYSYRKNIPIPTLLDAQPTDATAFVWNVAWSGNGNALAVATNASGAGLRFFTRSGSTLTSQSVPSNISLTRTAISSDGNYVAAGGSSTGRIWHNASGTLTNLTSVGSFSSSSNICAVSSDGSYVAFLSSSGPTFLRIKEKSGSGNSASYADMTLASQPTSGGGPYGGLAFSPDDAYLAVSPFNELNQAIYKFNSGTGVYEKLVSPFSGALPDSSVYGCTFSAQGDFLAITATSKTFFYERTGDTFTSVANIASGNPGGFHPSGNWYITGRGAIYKKNSASSWTLVQSLGLYTAAAFSPYI